MSDSLLSRLDAVVDDTVHTAVRARHERRLRRLHRSAALDPPDDDRLWAGGEPPPRPGCSLELLVEGARALPAARMEQRQAAVWDRTTPRPGSRGRLSPTCTITSRCAGRS